MSFKNVVLINFDPKFKASVQEALMQYGVVYTKNHLRAFGYYDQFTNALIRSILKSERRGKYGS